MEEQIEGKEYYIPTKKELLKYLDKSYIEKNKQYKALEKFIYKNVKYRELAEKLVDEITFTTRWKEIDMESVFFRC